MNNTDIPQAFASARERRWPVAFSSLLCLALLVPMAENWTSKPEDGFPLSYYPMFSHKRDGQTKVYHLVAIDAAGARHAIDYRLIGTGGFNQVRRQTRRILRDGGAAQLCRDVAERIAASPRDDQKGWIEVRAVVAWYDFDRFFKGDETPRDEEVWGSAPIPHGRPRPSTRVSEGRPS